MVWVFLGVAFAQLWQLGATFGHSRPAKPGGRASDNRFPVTARCCRKGNVGRTVGESVVWGG
eukprot:14249543-Alexandrium_andersonii.AAC.1